MNMRNIRADKVVEVSELIRDTIREARAGRANILECLVAQGVELAITTMAAYGPNMKAGPAISKMIARVQKAIVEAAMDEVQKILAEAN